MKFRAVGVAIVHCWTLEAMLFNAIAKTIEMSHFCSFWLLIFLIFRNFVNRIIFLNSLLFFHLTLLIAINFWHIVFFCSKLWCCHMYASFTSVPRLPQTIEIITECSKLVRVSQRHCFPSNAWSSLGRCSPGGVGEDASTIDVPSQSFEYYS